MAAATAAQPTPSIPMARREFGGLTGDLAGWFLQVCELGCLAAMVLAREIAEVLI